jgi:hypothetical protein
VAQGGARGSGSHFEYTHDLRHLIGLVEAAGVAFPLDIPDVVMYTEFAVPLRYEDLLDAEPLDPGAAVALVNDVATWAQGMLDRDRTQRPMGQD